MISQLKYAKPFLYLLSSTSHYDTISLASHESNHDYHHTILAAPKYPKYLLNLPLQIPYHLKQWHQA